MRIICFAELGASFARSAIAQDVQEETDQTEVEAGTNSIYTPARKPRWPMTSCSMAR